jgi:hypothetical protein
LDNGKAKGDADMIDEKQCERIYLAVEAGIAGESVAVPDLLDVLARFVAAAILAAPSVKTEMAESFSQSLVGYLNEYERPDKMQ